MMIGDKLRKVYCFSLILAYSRMKAIVFSLSCDGDAIYESIQELFSELGGVTYEILIDNPKALVESNENGKETKYNLNALSSSRSRSKCVCSLQSTYERKG